MPLIPNHNPSPIQEIDLSLFGIEGYSLHIKRDDLIHPFVSGNKFRKLKYNLLQAQIENHDTLLTFGGAYSNHIAAVAAAGKEMSFKTIGVIRGEELESKITDNPTLSFAKQCGMEFLFISREEYRNKESHSYLNNLVQKLGRCYIIPEGGTNLFAVKGSEEILDNTTIGFDCICIAVGTGGTMAGLVKASEEHQNILGFSALKGTFQTSEIVKYTNKTNFSITDKYCFGGYAKIDLELIRFINKFKEKTDIPLDPIYTGKMMYGVFELLKNGHFRENSRIFAVHTGGLQGIAGANKMLKKKNLPTIE